MQKIFFHPVKSIWMPVLITVCVCLVLWCIYGLFSLLCKGEQKKANKNFYVLTVILAAISLGFLAAMSVKFQKDFFENVVPSNTLDSRKYSVLLVAGFLATLCISLVIYASIIVIRKTNSEKRDRRSFRVIPRLFAYIALILSLAFSFFAFYVLLNNLAESFNNHKLSLGAFNFFYYNSDKNASYVNHMADLSVFAIASFTVFTYILLALNENKKVNVAKYISDTILGIIFVALFSFFSIEALSEKLAGPLSLIRLLPVAFIVALFSYKYGFRRTFPFALLSAQLLSAVSTTWNYSVLLQTSSEPIRYTFAGLIFMFYIPTVMMSLFGPIIGKKNPCGGATLATIILFALRSLPLLFMVVAFAGSKGTIRHMDKMSIATVYVYLAYEHLATLIMFIFLNFVKKGKILLKSERELNFTEDQEWKEFEDQFKKSKKAA